MQLTLASRVLGQAVHFINILIIRDINNVELGLYGTFAALYSIFFGLNTHEINYQVLSRNSNVAGMCRTLFVGTIAEIIFVLICCFFLWRLGGSPLSLAFLLLLVLSTRIDLLLHVLTIPLRFFGKNKQFEKRFFAKILACEVMLALVFTVA